MGDSFPPHRLAAAVLTLAAAILAILAGRTLFRALSSSDVPSNPLLIAVSGDVNEPGYYLLEGPAVTVGQAVEAAGGLRGAPAIAIPPALTARPVGGGQAVRLTTSGQGPAEVAIEPMPAAPRLTLGEKLDVNRASADELMLVPQMKVDAAAAIVNRRRQSCWRSLAELEKIPGVGPKTVERWQLYLTAVDCSTGGKDDHQP